MTLEYIYNNADQKLRAESLLFALFEVENATIENYKEGNTITVSCDGSPAFFVFDPTLIDHGNLGWKLAAKVAGEVFFGHKPDVRKVAARAEEIYSKSIQADVQALEVKEYMPDSNYSPLLGGVVKMGGEDFNPYLK